MPHNTQHNDTQHIDTRHNDKNTTLSIMTLDSIMPNAVMLSVVMLSVENKPITLSFVAPYSMGRLNYKYGTSPIFVPKPTRVE